MSRVAALTLLIAAIIFMAFRWGSFVAGGSDSACYATQAVRWAQLLTHPLSASLQPPDPLALSAPWPDAGSTFAPTGHVASRSVAGAFVPICPAGLSMVMAPLYIAGGPALMFAVVPLFGVALVLAVYRLGNRFNTRVGMAAAFLTGSSPVFLYQLVQPMSDVPAAALWVTAIACATGTKRRDAMFAGMATSLAVLMRPNLVPLGVVIGAFLLLRPERSRSVRIRSALIYALWSAPGCVVVAILQAYFYGSPLASGYGSFDALFSLSHVGPNLTRYLTWLWGSQTPAIGLAVLALALLPGALTTALLALFVTNLVLFLPYTVFDDWSFTRFLLPTVPMLLVLVAAAIDCLVVRLFGAGISPADSSARRRLAVAIGLIVAVICALLLQQAVRRKAFELRAMERRFARAGQFVAERLPADAFVITDYESASVPFYSGRRTLAWRALDPAWLDRAIAFARARGFEPYLMFERWEEPEFRARFTGSDVGRLDWPPVAEVATQVRIYRVSDRDRYRQGVAVPTEYAR